MNSFSTALKIHNSFIFQILMFKILTSIGANLLTFSCLKIVRKENQTIVRETDVYLPNITITAQNNRLLHQCGFGISSE